MADDYSRRARRLLLRSRPMRPSSEDSSRRDMDRRRQDRSFYLQLAGFILIIAGGWTQFTRQATVIQENAANQQKQIEEVRLTVNTFITANQQSAVLEAERRGKQEGKFEQLEARIADATQKAEQALARATNAQIEAKK